MKKRMKITIIVIIVVLILIATAIFTVIYNKNKNNEKQISALGNLPKEISLEYVIKEGYFVINNVDNKIYNKDILDRFIKNTEFNAKDRVADKIRIAVYNIDGYPTVYELEYNEKGYILTTDATRNNIIPREITTNDNIPSKFYGITLIEHSEFNAMSISLALYAQIQYDNTNTKPYEEIEIARYPLDSKIVNREIDPNEVTTIDIEKGFILEGESQNKITINQEEIYDMFEIINSLNFTKETCDGFPNYCIKINSREKENYKTYGIEVYSNAYHITLAEKGEAIVAKEQAEKLSKILEKYFK